MSLSRISITVFGALALAACTSDRIDPVNPLAVSPSHSVSTAASARYLVLAKGSGFSVDFGARVAALGGTVDQLHKGAGIAVLSNLSPSAVSQVAGFSDVGDLQADVDIALDAPIAATESAVATDSLTSVSNPAVAARYVWQWNMRLINANAPLGVQVTKEAGRKFIEAGEQAAIAAVATIRERVMQSADAAEGIRSFVERRAAVFQGR